MKVVIVGAGEAGFHIASHLTAENKEVVVIDKCTDAIQRVSDNLDVQAIQGSGSSPGAADVGELANGRIKFVGIYMDQISRLAGVKLAELPDKITQVKLLIAAIVREEELIIPTVNFCYNKSGGAKDHA